MENQQNNAPAEALSLGVLRFKSALAEVADAKILRPNILSPNSQEVADLSTTDVTVIPRNATCRHAKCSRLIICTNRNRAGAS